MGSYRYGLWSCIEDDKFNPNDLGYLQSNNEIKSGLSLSHHQLKENKDFLLIQSEFELIYCRHCLMMEITIKNL